MGKILDSLTWTVVSGLVITVIMVWLISVIGS